MALTMADTMMVRASQVVIGDTLIHTTIGQVIGSKVTGIDRSYNDPMLTFFVLEDGHTVDAHAIRYQHVHIVKR